MKFLIRITTSTCNDIYPLFIVDCENLSDKETEQLISSTLLEYTGWDEETVAVNEDGIYSNGIDYWYQEDIQQISDEDAAHLERILGISTFKR